MRVVFIMISLIVGGDVLSQGVSEAWDRGFYSDVAIVAQYHESVQEVNVDFLRLLFKIKEKGVFDLNSVRVYETDGNGKVIGKDLPSKFILDKREKGYGKVVFQVRGEKDLSKSEKIYRVYFDVLEHGEKPKSNYADIGEANLIPDPSFEEGDAVKIPKSPHFRPIGESRIHDLTMGHSGTKSIRMRSPKDKNGIAISVTSEPSYKKLGIRIKPSTPYKFSMWIKGKELTPNSIGKRKLIILGGAYWYKGFENGKIDYISPWKHWGELNFPRNKAKFSFDWKELRAVLLSPSNARAIKFVVKIFPVTGYVWLDDCLITLASIPELTKAYKIRNLK